VSRIIEDRFVGMAIANIGAPRLPTPGRFAETQIPISSLIGCPFPWFSPGAPWVSAAVSIIIFFFLVVFFSLVSLLAMCYSLRDGALGGPRPIHLGFF